MSSQSGSRVTAPLDPEPLAATAAGLRAWISSGACQSPNGAFVAWFDLVENRRAYEYPEISGYALSYLAGQAALSDQERSAAHRAADWLSERVRTGNLAARDGWDNNAVYLFDLGMIACGLLSFGRRAEVEEYLESGLRLASVLSEETTAAHSISPVSRHGPQSGRAGWSTRGVLHLAKLVQALLLADEFGGDAGRSVSARLIEAVEALQAADGRIPSDGATVMLHPHLYAAEGLWIWASAVGDDDALEHAKAALDWVWTQQLEEGGLPRSAPGSDAGGVALEQSDVTAQAARLALALGLRSAPLDRAVARLIDVARRHDAGLAIVYQPGSSSVHLNTWATLFGAQALAAASPEAPALSWRELV